MAASLLPLHSSRCARVLFLGRIFSPLRTASHWSLSVIRVWARWLHWDTAMLSEKSLDSMFRAFWVGLCGERLTSTNCPASSRSRRYSSNGIWSSCSLGTLVCWILKRPLSLDASTWRRVIQFIILETLHFLFICS